MKQRHLASRIASRLRAWMGAEAGAGILLMLAVAAAIFCANSALAVPYHALLENRRALPLIGTLPALHTVINDGLMAIFFFTVGLEIKREVLDGELSSPQQRRLPVLAAAAGMALPAAIFLALSAGRPELVRGWAIPAATDIAFAMGIVALLGKRVPDALRLFLLTVAIVDDLGAVVIIAVFYAGDLALAWLGAALAVFAVMVLMERMRVANGWVYAAAALALWLCVLHSGVHPTIAGVLAALTIPLRLDRGGDSLLLRMEHALTPWSGYLIVPLFGFANAGLSLHGGGTAALLAPLPFAIAAGLVLGKQGGIFGAILLAEFSGFAPRPAGTSWRQVWGMALLCGIGFTMSLFIAALAFPAAPLLAGQAKLGILAGSLLSALAGYAVLRCGGKRDQARLR